MSEKTKKYLPPSLLAREINWLETVIHSYKLSSEARSLLAREINWLETGSRTVHCSLSSSQTPYSLGKLIDSDLTKKKPQFLLEL
jgi:hypothetical protein